MCLSITTTADERCEALVESARAVSLKFTKAFLLFSKCHNVYSSRYHLSDDDLDDLGTIYHYFRRVTFICVLIEKRIKEFLLYIWHEFPETSITPKLHLIEDHMVDFLQKWKVGCELLGEQGAESIHITFNEFHRHYANIRKSVAQLRQVTMEHHRRTSPLLNCHRPPLQQNTKPEQ